MESEVGIQANGIVMRGTLHFPSLNAGKGRFPAMVVLHGFGANRQGDNHIAEARTYQAAGYLVVRFDMRGCGESGGSAGHLICNEIVSDTIAIVNWLKQRDDVDPKKIFVSGQSFGGALAIAAASRTTDIAGAVSISGWGDGEAKFRRQHEAGQAWNTFEAILAEAKHAEAEPTPSVSRWSIVPIPEEQRGKLPPGSLMHFTAATALSMFEFRPLESIGRIAPRPVLLVHGAHDEVTPVQESVDLFQGSGSGCDLIILSEIDHFPLGADRSRLKTIITDWALSVAQAD